MIVDRKIKLLSIVLLGLFLFSTALIGCGPVDDDEIDVGDPVDPVVEDPDEARPPEDRILRYTMANTPQIDPARGSDHASASALVNLYDTLMYPNYDGTIEPHVATDWDVSEDGLTYTFNLRDDVVFHNGDNLTAHDVVFSMERLLTVGEGYAYLFTGRVEQVTALDEYTVEFQLSETFGPFLAALVRLYIVNKDLVLDNIDDGAYGDMGDYGTEWLRDNDAGSGPYMVRELLHGEHFIADKYDDYWSGFEPNNPEGFKLIGSNEPVTVRTLIARRELEISDEYQPAENYQAMADIEGVEVAEFASGKILQLTLHNQKPPTDCIHFRRAMAHIIDYEGLTEHAFPGALPAQGPVSTALPGHYANVTVYEHSIEKAQEELQQSQYYDELDNYPIDVVWVSETPDREKLALDVQAKAVAAGIQVNVVRTPWVSLVEQVSSPETTPHAAIVLMPPHYGEAGSLLESGFHSDSLGTWENMSWRDDEAIDSYINQALSTVDRDKRFQRYYEAQERIMEVLPDIPVLDEPEKLAYQKAYMAWEPAERLERGEMVLPVVGYMFYMKNIEFIE